MNQDPLGSINNLLDIFRKFIESTTFNPNVIRCLFVNAYNSFLAGRMLAESGLITQSNNCLRMGLESTWLGLILLKEPELGLQWAFGIAVDGAKNVLISLENPSEIRQRLPATARIKVEDRRDLYKALSDKSHTKLSSVTRFSMPPNSSPGDGFIDCIPMGGMRGEENIARILRPVETVLTFALAEIEDSLQQRLLDKDWVWNRVDLVDISEGGGGNDDGSFEPHVTSQGHPGADPMQAMALLNAIRHQRI